MPQPPLRREEITGDGVYANAFGTCTLIEGNIEIALAKGLI